MVAAEGRGMTELSVCTTQDAACACGPYIVQTAQGVILFHRDKVARAMDKTRSPLGPYVKQWQAECVL